MLAHAQTCGAEVLRLLCSKGHPKWTKFPEDEATGRREHEQGWLAAIIFNRPWPVCFFFIWGILLCDRKCYTAEGGLLRWYCCSVWRLRSSRSR